VGFQKQGVAGIWVNAGVKCRQWIERAEQEMPEMRDPMRVAIRLILKFLIGLGLIMRALGIGVALVFIGGQRGNQGEHGQ